jgi:hypothetical protein
MLVSSARIFIFIKYLGIWKINLVTHFIKIQSKLCKSLRNFKYSLGEQTPKLNSRE